VANSITNSTYDSAFKSIIYKSPRLVLPLINELFYKPGYIKERYIGNETVTLLDKELPDIGGNGIEMDLLVAVSDVSRRTYHLECQSTSDNSMALRMVQYDFRNALDNADLGNSSISMTVIDSGVLYLRNSGLEHSEITVTLNLPQERSASYKIPVISMRDYTIGQIIDSKIYMLLPFMFFNHEKLLREVPSDSDARTQLKNIVSEMRVKLKTAAETDVITAYEASTVYEAAATILRQLAKKANAKKEVDEIMCGEILTFSADKYFQDGEAKGEARGEARGLDMFGNLVKELIRLKRMDDIVRVTEDRQYRDKLLNEFNLKDISLKPAE
jgi:hypothetical protein